MSIKRKRQDTERGRLRNKKRRRDQKRGERVNKEKMRLYDKKDLNIRRKLERDQKRKKPKRKKNRKRESIEFKTEKPNIKICFTN